MRLTGDRNQCPSCLLGFNSTPAFDKHRTGPFDGGRRCLTEAEMLAKGMAKASSGFWVTRPMSADTLSRVTVEA
jgi:hypothetical protein